MKANFPILSAAMLALTLLGAGCGRHATPSQPVPPSVTVSRPSLETVTEYLELTGTLAPSRTVDLVARVTGYLRSIEFEDGTFVEPGQPLFVIEPEPYEQQLALAEASLLRAQAEYNRQEGLMRENATSASNVEHWRSESDQARAQVELAKINLSYTRVTAPFAGRIGRRLVDAGNLVGPSANTRLATLDQLVPLYVCFNLDERAALRTWEQLRQRGLDRRDALRQTIVEVGVQNEAGYPHTGTLDFVDTGVSVTSGMIPMRGVLRNEDKGLFPGLFARVRITLGEARTMLVVPPSAIGNDQEGDYVLVADAQDTVLRRTVVKGPLTRAGCAIRSGLNPEDRVVVSGLSRAQPGAKVVPMERPGSGAAPEAPGAGRAPAASPSGH